MEQWSPEHIAALVATGTASAAIVAYARRWGQRWTVASGRALAVVILGGFVCEQVIYALRHESNVRVNLPLQLSDAVTLASVAALWRPEATLLVELVYFWALSASVQPVLTPDLMQSFPDPLFFTYFATHSGAIAAACVLVFGARRTPPRPVARVRHHGRGRRGGHSGHGGNYMFLQRKPVGGSLLDLMGPWPVYIVSAPRLGCCSSSPSRRWPDELSGARRRLRSNKRSHPDRRRRVARGGGSRLRTAACRAKGKRPQPRRPTLRA